MVQNQFGGRTAAEIAFSIETALRKSGTRAGETLPTIRALAASLAVSPATVAAAYKTLHGRGVVVGRGRGGTRVAPQERSRPAFSRQRTSDNTGDLASGNPDPALLPPLDMALQSVGREPRLYGQSPTLAALGRFGAAEFEADGISASSMTVVGGGLDGIDLVLREHLRPGDRVGIEDPIYPGLPDLVTAAGFVPEPFAIDDDGPRPEAFAAALKRGCQAVVVTPRAQNPTGAALTEGRGRELTRVLRRYPDTLLVEDDHAGPVAGAPARTLSAKRTRWAVVRSTAKFLGPDLRVALMAGDPLSIARVESRQAIGLRWVSYILQQLALALWSDPSSGRLLAHAANVYRHRRAALRAALDRHGIPSHGRSGFNVWIPLSEETRIVRALAEAGWSVAPGERFRLRADSGIRVTTAALMPAQAEQFAATLGTVLPQTASGFA